MTVQMIGTRVHAALAELRANASQVRDLPLVKIWNGFRRYLEFGPLRRISKEPVAERVICQESET